MAYVVMTYTRMIYVVIAYAVMVYIVMAHIVMTYSTFVIPIKVENRAYAVCLSSAPSTGSAKSHDRTRLRADIAPRHVFMRSSSADPCVCARVRACTCARAGVRGVWLWQAFA